MHEGELLYRANLPAVAHEAFEDEAILIQFESGRYYSLNETGRDAWQEIVRGASAASIARALAQRYDAPEPAILDALAPFLEALTEQALVVAQRSPDVPPDGAPAPADGAATRRRFTPPRVEVYTDMEDLLLLDPIHDVDETGWPRAKR